ncbi:hypothetical protein L6164_013600 [Bauhinia variegata]|uniref:Uncharacterized protein n=1 Tax=Bauhinia variegata TaxID=167791 RepID=A0ACB9NJK4_BAUVA|nr:hypothetical protein L6164_013600 [Bauhinia variegata]
MSSIYKLLNFSLPIIMLVLIPILMLPYLFAKLLLSVKKVVCSENLARKVVIITGAASGIGEQLAYEYARRGALLSLVDIRKDNLGAVANKARSLGSPNAIIIGADVSKVQDCKQFVDETLNHFGRLDHMVNNAGICKSEAVENVDDVSLVTPIMDVNFWGAVYGTLFAIPHLQSSKGKVVVVASAGGWFPVPLFSIYNASKAAINFLEILRIELGWVIGITIVNPGGIETPLSDAISKHWGLARSKPTSGALDRVAEKFEPPFSLRHDFIFVAISSFLMKAVLAWPSILAQANKGKKPWEKLISVSDIVKKHRGTFGRNFFSGYGYEEYESEGTNKIIEPYEFFFFKSKPGDKFGKWKCGMKTRCPVCFYGWIKNYIPLISMWRPFFLSQLVFSCDDSKIPGNL